MLQGGTRDDTDKKKRMDTDSRGLLREATFKIRVHPWISVFIPVKYCDTDGGGRQRQPDTGSLKRL